METMNSNVYLVTDVASGLGKAIAHGLARTGGTVLIVARDDEIGSRVEGDVSVADQNPKIELFLSDLSNILSVRNLAEIIRSKYAKIDVLINNHSVYKKQRELTVDGFETMFAANHLGPFLLTNLLLERLRASAGARIINITGPATNELAFDDLQGERHFNSRHMLDMTRMANLLFTLELARRLENTDIKVNALYPGLVRSAIEKEASPLIRFIAWLFASTPVQAAEGIVKMATEPGIPQTQGKFFFKGEETELPAYALNPDAQQRLWEISEVLTDAKWQGPNYDPTGSVAMYNKREIPEEILRPQEDPTIEENGVVKRK